MNRISLYHNSRLPEYRFPFGAAPCGSTVSFCLDVTGLSADCLCSLRIWYQDSGETLVPMRTAEKTSDLSAAGGAAGSETGPPRLRFIAHYTTPKTPGLVWYYFIAQSSGGVVRYYGNNEQNRGGEGQESFSPPPSYQLTVYEAYDIPDWWKEGFVYQLYVDRFARGADWQQRFFDAQGPDTRQGPTRILQSDWRDAPFLYKDDRGWVVRWPFFGGTLEGVREKLAYLHSLGVTILYLNPIFEAASNHKYDTGDYMKIDPGYGDEAAFRRLALEAETWGISLILDGVFSHTGADSVYFNKYGNYPSLGAWQSEDSPYRSWYRFNSHDPNAYECWWNVADLPNVEENNPAYQSYIWGAEDSVIRHWIRAGAKGWRLDVADEMPDAFIQNIKTAMLETDPDGLLLGEVWEDASNKRSYGVMREYLLGRELDATMNYPFRKWALDFIMNHIGPAEVHDRVMNLYENYPRAHFFSCMNLLGSHDRMRVLSILGEAPNENDLSEWQRQCYRLDPDQKDLARRRLKLLSLWQTAFPGVPSVFYGDEAGLEGYSDPYNRGPYPWGREDWDLLGWYRVVGNLRAEYAVLRNGDFTSLGGYTCLYAFLRHNERERLFVFLNASRSAGEDAVLPLLPGETICVDLLAGALLDGQPEIPDGAKDGDGNEAGRRLRLHIGPLECKAVYLKQAAPASLVMKNAPRAAGILCHITSLPSQTGCGDFGRAAYDFCDYLAAAGQRIWQILPLTPVGPGDSPYSGCSAFAGSELFLDCAAFVADGLLTEADLPRSASAADPGGAGAGAGGKTDYALAAACKYPAFEKAFRAFDENDKDFQDFCRENDHWLADYCLYRAISADRGGRPWQEWPADIRDRRADALAAYGARLSDAVAFHRFLQYQFEKQWRALKAHAGRRGISILGDLPIYVAAGSCDTWVDRDLFHLDDCGYPALTGGCPPDAFTEGGQNWKNPTFRWAENRASGYDWWIRRFRRNLQLCDYLRLDHFRGFDACWEIPGDQETGAGGRWIKGPGKAFFETVEAALGPLPLLAENLGYITANAEDLRNTFAWPGMLVYQFHADRMVSEAVRTARAAAGDGGQAKTASNGDGGQTEAATGENNERAGMAANENDGRADATAGENNGRAKMTPPAIPSADFLQVFYTGTHDNNTLAGWLEDQRRESAAAAPGQAADPAQTASRAGGDPRRARIPGAASPAIQAACADIIEDLYAAAAMWVILPLQDAWFLDGRARMNIPGVAEGNWTWAASPDAFTEASALYLRTLAQKYGRK